MSRHRRLMMQKAMDESSVDLSVYDIYGNPIERSTANCYVISKPGRYKFPLVFGNAILNGKTNASAYSNNNNYSSDNFKDAYLNNIISPYIEDAYGLVTGASLYNTDTENVISEVSLVDDSLCKYLQFKVSSVPAEGANCILAVDDGTTVLWSWHIWIWPHDLSPVTIVNSDYKQYKILPNNLASKYDSDGIHIKNWFYQWGRKDPMLLPSAWDSSVNHTPGEFNILSRAGVLSEGIQDPNTFFHNANSPYNWFGSKGYNNLWDACLVNSGQNDYNTVKTIYDPCPVGWKIPNGRTFNGLGTIERRDGKVYLARYSGDTTGVEFPFSGRRSYTDGGLGVVGSNGIVHTTANGPSNSIYAMSFGSTSISYSSTYYRSYGLSVRPVEDTRVGSVEIINFTIDGKSFQAEEGMTWFEWVYSEYCTENWWLSASGKVERWDDYYIYGAHISDTIINGQSYDVILN